MLGSLYSSISGMKAHKTKLDVVGNNISNVDTTGYKKTSVNFEETMTQTIKGARGPIDGQGGINPATIGLGTKVSSINPSFESGAQQTTGRKTDLRIDGNGFFIVADGNNKMYTRSGNFNLDGNGNLVTPNGMKVPVSFKNILHLHILNQNYVLPFDYTHPHFWLRKLILDNKFSWA